MRRSIERALGRLKRVRARYARKAQRDSDVLTLEVPNGLKGDGEHTSVLGVFELQEEKGGRGYRVGSAGSQREAIGFRVSQGSVEAFLSGFTAWTGQRVRNFYGHGVLFDYKDGDGYKRRNGRRFAAKLNDSVF